MTQGHAKRRLQSSKSTFAPDRAPGLPAAPPGQRQRTLGAGPAPLVGSAPRSSAGRRTPWQGPGQRGAMRGWPGTWPAGSPSPRQRRRSTAGCACGRAARPRPPRGAGRRGCRRGRNRSIGGRPRRPRHGETTRPPRASPPQRQDGAARRPGRALRRAVPARVPQAPQHDVHS